MLQRLFTLAVLVNAVVLQAQAQQIQDCYYYDGDTAPNNTVCADSAACCGPTATCTTERLCHNQGDPAGTFVRGPCSRKDWSSVECPQICLYDESNGVFPRVEQCKDGSWCCYNLENESKAETCCASGLGTFLDDTGVVTNGPASSTSSSAGSATSTSRTTKTSNPSASASPTSAPDSSGLSTGAKIGLGVGIGLGVLVLAAASIILWLLLRKRRNNESEPSKEASSKEASSLDELQPNSDVRSHYAEVPDSSRGEPYQDYKAYLHAPAEMSGEQSRHEMDGSSPQELPVGHIREVNDGK